MEGGIVPAQFLHEMITLVDQQKGDEALYQFVLALPPLYRDTVLFTLRLAWQYFLFRGPWTYNHSEEQFASHCVIMALPKRLVFDEHINVDSLTKCVVGLLHAVALHKREEFLPEDPTVLEIEKYKVHHREPAPAGADGGDHVHLRHPAASQHVRVQSAQAAGDGRPSRVHLPEDQRGDDEDGDDARVCEGPDDAESVRGQRDLRRAARGAGADRRACSRDA